MAEEGLWIKLNADFDELERQLQSKELSKDIQVEGEAGGVSAGGDGGGEDGLLTMAAELGAVAALLGVIVGILTDLAPIVALFEQFMTIVTVFLLPIAIILYKLLEPFMKTLLRAAPAWLKLFEKFDIYDIASAIGDELDRMLSGFLTGVGQSVMPGGSSGFLTGTHDFLGFLQNPLRPVRRVVETQQNMREGNLFPNMNFNVYSMVDESAAVEMFDKAKENMPFMLGWTD